MNNLTTKTIREIALEMPQTTRVFEELKIDYCCGGRKMFLEACETAGIPPEFVMSRIEDVLKSAEPLTDSLTGSTPGELIDHILTKHHAFTKSEIEHLKPLMVKVFDRHGETHKYLLELKLAVFDLFEDLIPHMHKEEVILFPYIRQLELAKDQISSLSPPFGTVRNPIMMMMKEHDQVGEILRKMRELSDGYKLPEGACPSYTALLSRLEALERDLHLHIHLENNLLFPMALELEEKSFPSIPA